MRSYEGVTRITTGVNLLAELQTTVLRLTVCDAHIKQIALHSTTTMSGRGHVTRGRFLTQRTRVDLNTRNADALCTFLTAKTFAQHFPSTNHTL